MVKTNLRCAGASDPGRVRHNNEDALYVDAERGIFLVVDGIGGQAAGEKAAAIAVERIRARLERQTGAAEQRIREAIAMANNEILRQARANPEWEGMACVLTVVVLDNGSLVAGHVGDSRLYQIRRGEIRKITHDHSPVGEREDNGELTEAEAMRHPRRNEVFRDVGSEEHEPDDNDFIEVRRLPFDPDSALVLCSDGLSDLVASNDIRRVVARNAGNPQGAVKDLIAAANAAGGKDNVTVVVVEGEGFAGAAAEAPVAKGSGWRRGAALFLLGALLAAAAAWFTRGLWTPAPPPVVIRPRVLAVGQGARYGTIMEAMAEARAGDSIEVGTGEYREEVHLKSGVALRSRTPGDAVLRAAPVGGGPAVWAEKAAGARLSGFRILGDAAMPLKQGVLLISSDVEMDDLDVEGANVGIEIRGGRPTLRASRIADCLERGVWVTGDAAPWISHNTFRATHGPALVVEESARPVLVDNVFEKGAVQIPAAMMALVKQRNLFLETARQPGKRKQE
jgi:serine/threonine protein phosphatase PrpC